MSQVVVTNDNLREKRAKSLGEEQRIDRQSQFDRWQRTVGKTTPLVERLIGVAVLPIAFFWGMLLSLLGAGLSLALVTFKVLAALWPAYRKKRPAS